MKQHTLILDGDVFRYQLAFSNTRAVSFDEGDDLVSVNPEKAKCDLDDMIGGLVDKLKATDYVMPLSKGVPFRKHIFPAYKENRAGKPKPALWYLLDDYMRSLCGDRILEVDGIEADDTIGLLATHPKPRLAPGKRTVVSIDKDFLAVPCRLYNPGKPELGTRVITEDGANLNWMMQTLTGDTADNYKGIPGIGPKKAAAILDGVTALPDLWEAVVTAFDEKGLTADDALLQARLARILRHGDYNYTTGEVRLWEP